MNDEPTPDRPPTVMSRTRMAWFCLRCSRCGEVPSSVVSGVTVLVKAIKEHHAAISPKCPNGSKVIASKTVEVK